MASVWIAGAMHRAGAFEQGDGGELSDAALTGVREEVLAQVEGLLRVADATATLSLIVVAEQAGEVCSHPSAPRARGSTRSARQRSGWRLTRTLSSWWSPGGR